MIRLWSKPLFVALFVLLGVMACDKVEVDPNELRLDYHPSLSSDSEKGVEKTPEKTSALNMASLGLLQGKVTVNEHQKPKHGGRLLGGDVLHGSGKKAFVELSFIDGSLLRAAGFQTLALEQVVFKVQGQPLRRVSLMAEGGDWWLHTHDLTGVPGEIEVKTSRMTVTLKEPATVRLSFGVQGMLVQAREGRAELTWTGRETPVIVSQGEEIRLPISGEPLGEPKAFIGTDAFTDRMLALDKGLKAFREFTNALQKQSVAALIFPPDGPETETVEEDDAAQRQHAEGYYRVMQPRFDDRQWATLEPNLRIFVDSNPRPSSVKARTWLAECLVDQQRYNEAARVAGETFRRFPKNDHAERLKTVLDAAAAGLVAKTKGQP